VLFAKLQKHVLGIVIRKSDNIYVIHVTLKNIVIWRKVQVKI